MWCCYFTLELHKRVNRAVKLFEALNRSLVMVDPSIIWCACVHVCMCESVRVSCSLSFYLSLIRTRARTTFLSSSRTHTHTEYTHVNTPKKTQTPWTHHALTYIISLYYFRLAKHVHTYTRACARSTGMTCKWVVTQYRYLLVYVYIITMTAIIKRFCYCTKVFCYYC